MSTHQAGYIHGTAETEQARLRALNRLTNGAFVRFLDVAAGQVVLDVGSGLGLLAADVAASAAGVQVIGIDRSLTQLRAASPAAGVARVMADAHLLPFHGGAFDLAYARYVLEHVGDPLAVLREVRRVVKPGGRIAIMENDISLVRFDPPCPRFEVVWTRFAALQQQLGGDPFIGRRLYRLLQAAGLQRIALSVQPEVHWHGSPHWEPWVVNIIGNLESGRDALAARQLVTSEEVDGAIQELRGLIARADGSATFVWNRALCYRDGRA